MFFLGMLRLGLLGAFGHGLSRTRKARFRPAWVAKARHHSCMSWLDQSRFLVVALVALLTHAKSVCQSVCVLTVPSHGASSVFSVARLTHIFGIMFSINMRTLCHLHGQSLIRAIWLSTGLLNLSWVRLNLSLVLLVLWVLLVLLAWA